MLGTGVWEGIEKLILMFDERKPNQQEFDNASTNKDSKPVTDENKW